MIILCLTIVFVAIVFFLVFAVKCIQFGLDNKYDYDEQMFLEGSKLPPISGEEN